MPLLIAVYDDNLTIVVHAYNERAEALLEQYRVQNHTAQEQCSDAVRL